MTIEEQMENFKEAYKKTEILYGSGKYREANNPSLRAVNAAIEILVMALRKKGWTARHVGYKNSDVRDAAYKTAGACAREILRMSEDPEARNSAIKLLILLPGAKTKELCEMGLKELDEAYFIYQKRDNLKAELMNSLGLEVRKTEPSEAFAIFTEAFEIVEKGTTIAGHLMHNAGTCFLILKNASKPVEQKEFNALKAIKYLQVAFDNYPEDQKGHREAVEKKIANTREEIENKFQ